jgi:uncharacterized protein YceH (UPF0502 family)
MHAPLRHDSYNKCMNIELSALEARIVGCLIEKQITTPEQYPMSLNALTNACNQKSNRDPVLQLPETEVQALVDGLSRKHLLLERSGFGSRVPKYQQRFCNTEFSVLQFSAQERAIVCELLLRGPQTPGELRSRAARMAPFADAGEVEAALEALANRESGPMVRRLAREPGRRDSRYAHLFGTDRASIASAGNDPAPEPAGTAQPTAAPPSSTASVPAGTPVPAPRVDAVSQRLAMLETEVRALREELEQLKRRG